MNRCWTRGSLSNHSFPTRHVDASWSTGRYPGSRATHTASATIHPFARSAGSDASLQQLTSHSQSTISRDQGRALLDYYEADEC